MEARADKNTKLSGLTFRTDVLCLAECQNQLEYRRQEKQAEAEADTLAEGLGKPEVQNNEVNKIDERDQ